VDKQRHQKLHVYPYHSLTNAYVIHFVPEEDGLTRRGRNM